MKTINHIHSVSRHHAGDLHNDDMEVRLWNLQTGELLGTVDEPGIDASLLALSPDGKTVATPVGGVNIRLWDIGRLPEGIVR